MPGQKLLPAFGAGSAAKHRGLGLHEIRLPAASSVRVDVDTVEQLRTAGATLGPTTRAALA